MHCFKLYPAPDQAAWPSAEASTHTLHIPEACRGLNLEPESPGFQTQPEGFFNFCFFNRLGRLGNFKLLTIKNAIVHTIIEYYIIIFICKDNDKDAECACLPMNVV